MLALEEVSMTNTTNPIFTSPNRLKLGTFCTNGKGAAMTTVPEAYLATWPLSVKTAQLADRAGFEAIVPYARWKGYVPGKGDDVSGNVMDPLHLGRRSFASHSADRAVRDLACTDRTSRHGRQAVRNRRPDVRWPLRTQCGWRMEQAGIGDVRRPVERT